MDSTPAVVRTRDISREMNLSLATVERGLARQGIPVISLGVRKRFILRSHYDLLLAGRADEIKKAPR